MRKVRRTFLAALLISSAVAASPSGTSSAAVQPGDKLSPELAKLAQPSVRSLSLPAQAKVLDLPVTGPGSLMREGAGVLVNVRFEAGALARLEALKKAGGEIVAASQRYQTVTTSVPPADLQALSQVPGVGAVTAVPAPIVHAAGSCEGGSVISEGVEQLNVPDARAVFGLRGAGITVGILSDSYGTATQVPGGVPIATHAPEDVQSNDLPGPKGTCSGQQASVEVLEDWPSSPGDEVHDEGRAMAQIVHDIAPHAKLAFATAFGSEISFAENIEWLARPVAKGGAGATVIVDDVSYFEEPFFQDGPIANAIATVVERGVTYLTAAGNENRFQSGEEQVEGESGIASWEAPTFRDATSCPVAVAQLLAAELKAADCMDFDPGPDSDSTFRFTVAANASLTVDLQWSEPWQGVEADLNAYLLTGSQVVKGRLFDNTETQRPVELLHWENTSSSPRTVQLVIDRCATGCNPAAEPSAMPRLKFILIGRVRGSEYPSSHEGDVVGPTIYGHAASTNAIALGAVPAPPFGIDAPEEYSSRGPATHYYGPVFGTMPANALIPPETLEKPDVVATDCGATTFFAQLVASIWRFCGTSAAAPHAAAIAALMAQGAAGATPDEVAEALELAGRPVGSFGHDAIGAGLIDAQVALAEIGATPTNSDPPSTVVPPVPEYEPEPEPEEKQPEEPQPRSPESPESPAAPPTSPPTTQPAPTPPKTIPSTLIRNHPRKLVRTRRAVARVAFRFVSEPAGASFRCQFDGSRWRACGAKVRRWFGLGPHVVRVQARSKSGVLDPSPAVFRFRVARTLRAVSSQHRGQRR